MKSTTKTFSIEFSKEELTELSVYLYEALDSYRKRNLNNTADSVRKVWNEINYILDL